MSRRAGVGVAIAALIASGVVWKMCSGGGGGDANSATSAAKSKASAVKRRPRRKPVSAQPRATIAGTVKSKAGGVVAGARVCAWASGDDVAQADRAEPRCATTSAAGSYEIKGLLATEYWLGASAPHFLPKRFKRKRNRFRRYDLKLAAGERRDGVDFVLLPGGVKVSGVVKDIGGGPIGGALVYGRGAVVRADTNGKFTIWMERGTAWLRAAAEGYASSWERVPAPTDTAEIRLTPGAVLEGRVVRADTGEPVPQVAVSAGRRGRALSDANGRFRITRLEPGRYKPSAETVGIYGESAESVMVGIGETRSGIVIKVHPMAHVRGRVMVAGKNEPCTDPSVTLRGELDKSWGGSRGKPVGDGWVEFDTLAKGTYKVNVACKGYAAKAEYPDVKVTGADQTDLKWQVVAGGNIRGTVKTAAGNGVAGVRVYARRRNRLAFGYNPNASADTDTEGKFALDGLPAGKYEVRIYSQEHIGPKDPTKLELAKGKTEHVEITLKQDGRVAGIVVDKDGKPRAGYTVYLASKRWGGPEATSNSEGKFELRGVPVGKQEIAATRNREPFVTNRRKVAKVKVTVTADEAADARIVVDTTDGAITGRVVDAAGKPVTDAFVRAVVENGKKGRYTSATERSRRGWGADSVAVDPDGNFEIKNLGPGKYLVRAYRKGGGEAFKKHVEVGAEVTLTIQKTVTLSGTVSTTTGDAIERFKIHVNEADTGFSRDESFFATEGQWKISDLPAGKYTIVASAEEGEANATVELKPGESKDDVDFQLQGLATVVGTATVMGTGAPAKGLYVMAIPAKGDMQASMRKTFMQRVTTDDKGAFRVKRVPPGKVLVAVWGIRSEEYSGGAAVVDAEANQTASVKIPVVPKYVKKDDTVGDLGMKLNSTSMNPMSGLKPFKLTVTEVKAGGAAAAAGMRKGDVIVAIDGLDTTGYNAYRAMFFRKVRKGQSVRYELERGATVTITAR